MITESKLKLCFQKKKKKKKKKQEDTKKTKRLNGILVLTKDFTSCNTRKESSTFSCNSQLLRVGVANQPINYCC